MTTPELTLESIKLILIYKISSLITGLLCLFMGYKLFASKINSNAGTSDLSFHSMRIIIQQATPGTFFAILGGFIIIITITKGFDSTTEIISKNNSPDNLEISTNPELPSSAPHLD